MSVIAMSSLNASAISEQHPLVGSKESDDSMTTTNDEVTEALDQPLSAPTINMPKDYVSTDEDDATV